MTMTITSSSYYLVPSTRKSDLKSQMVYTSHAKERTGEREIKLRDGLTLEEILKMSVYTSDNGCIKYLDIEYNIVYYVRGTNIVTLIKTDPIQMLRYYAFGKGENVNKYCRDNVFNNCKRGSKCKYEHPYKVKCEVVEDDLCKIKHSKYSCKSVEKKSCVDDDGWTLVN